MNTVKNIGGTGGAELTTCGSPINGNQSVIARPAARRTVAAAA